MPALLEAGRSAVIVSSDRLATACWLALLASLVASAGCAGEPAAPSLREQRLAALHEIAARCGFPDSVLELEGDDDLHVRPPPDSPYERVDCLLKALKKADMPVKMGFVGNEAHDTGTPH